MINTDSCLAERDLQHNWHPCSQMKDYEEFPPLEIVGAEGSYLHLQSGDRLIDANSSWWCKSLGHQHPQLKQALMEQAEQFEHVIFANTTNETIVNLSEKLCGLTKNLNKVMYASDGSCAVEIALKMALHAKQIQQQPERTQVMALSNGYHGETCLTLSVSDLGLYKAPYTAFLQTGHFINDIPYVSGEHDPLWHDCGEQWQQIEKQLMPYKDSLCAVILEPIIQGAGGMLIYSQDFLKRLANWARQHDIYIIADEIMTGFGRSGRMFACDYAGIEADFLCVAKGLTGGWLPLSAMLTRDDIYQLFYDDYETGKAFLHSHTHTGNALAAGVANAALDIYQQAGFMDHLSQLAQTMKQAMDYVASQCDCLHNLRGIGGLVAADIQASSNQKRTGYAVYQAAVKHGALLRPLGNTIYWLPPLNTDRMTIERLADITIKALNDVL